MEALAATEGDVVLSAEVVKALVGEVQRLSAAASEGVEEEAEGGWEEAGGLEEGGLEEGGLEEGGQGGERARGLEEGGLLEKGGLEERGPVDGEDEKFGCRRSRTLDGRRGILRLSGDAPDMGAPFRGWGALPRPPKRRPSKATQTESADTIEIRLLESLDQERNKVRDLREALRRERGRRASRSRPEEPSSLLGAPPPPNTESDAKTEEVSASEADSTTATGNERSDSERERRLRSERERQHGGSSMEGDCGSSTVLCKAPSAAQFQFGGAISQARDNLLVSRLRQELDAAKDEIRKLRRRTFRQERAIGRPDARSAASEARVEREHEDAYSLHRAAGGGSGGRRSVPPARGVLTKEHRRTKNFFPKQQGGRTKEQGDLTGSKAPSGAWGDLLPMGPRELLPTGAWGGPRELYKEAPSDGSDFGASELSVAPLLTGEETGEESDYAQQCADEDHDGAPAVEECAENHGAAAGEEECAEDELHGEEVETSRGRPPRGEFGEDETYALRGRQSPPRLLRCEADAKSPPVFFMERCD